jgi:3',5'-cyclic AMP phosphodiesterase CpdA
VLTSADALVLTGDIAVSDTLSRTLIDLAAGFGRPVYFVLGNHDFYGQSFVNVGDKAERLGRKYPGLKWLTKAGVVHLTKTTALVGHDGWYDGRWGHVEHFRARMNDWKQIKDFKYATTDPLILDLCRERADMCARDIEPVLRTALDKYPEVIFATHVPPFPQNATYDRAEESNVDPYDSMPWYTNKAFGDMLMRLADAYPERKITVLCGHAHTHHEHEILPNLTCMTGLSTYRVPQLAGVLSI